MSRDRVFTQALGLQSTGKGSFLILVAESHLQSVAVSSLSLETKGIHHFLVRDLE